MKATLNHLRSSLAALLLAIAACCAGWASEFTVERTVVVKGNIEVMIVAEDSDLAALSESELSRRDASYVRSRDIQACFPRLDADKIEVVGHQTRKFNCIAWSMGVPGWVNPETGSKENPLAKMDAMYASLGYVRIDDLNTEVEPGLEKVAVYAKLAKDRSIESVTHACRQEPDGTWTSKLGAAPLIRHPDLESLEGPAYGTPVAIYVRPASVVLPAEERVAEVEIPTTQPQVASAELPSSEEVRPAAKRVAPARRVAASEGEKVTPAVKHVTPARRAAKSDSIVAEKDHLLAQ